MLLVQLVPFFLGVSFVSYRRVFPINILTAYIYICINRKQYFFQIYAIETSIFNFFYAIWNSNIC